MFTVTLVPIELLKPHPKNKEIPPIDESIRKEMLEDIRKNGIATPLILARDFTILAGHQRWEIAKELGMTYVPAIVREDIEPDSPEALALFIKDNLLRRHYNEMTLAKQIREWKELVGTRRGRPKAKDVRINTKKQDFLSEFLGKDERHIRRLDKLNDLILPLQKLVSANKLSHTAAYSLAFLPPEEQEQLLAVLGESGVCGLSVREAQELRRELDSLRKEKELLVKQLSELQKNQREVEELRTRLKEFEANPVEKVVEKVVYKTDPALEAELEAARKQSAELLKRNEFLEARFADIAREKEQKEAKLRQIETEKEMLERQCEHFKKEFLKEKKKPKPDLDRITVLNLMSQIVKSSVDLSSALKTLINKYPDQVLAFARVRGGADLEELGDIVAGTFSFKLLEMSLSDVVQKCMDFFDLLKQKPKLKVLRGGDSPDEGQKSAKEGD